MKTRIWILFVFVALLAVPSFAQLQYEQFREVETGDGGGGWSDVSTYNSGQYLDNPCTAVQDYAWVDFDVFVEGSQKTANVDRYLVDESTTAGGTYAARGSSFSDVAYGQMFTVRNYKKVNTYDNFHIVTVVDFDPYYQQTYVSIETACGDGTPGSKE